MTILRSINDLRLAGAPGAYRTLADAEVNAPCVVTIPAGGSGFIHIPLLVAGFTFNNPVISKVLTMVQGAVTRSYTINGLLTAGAGEDEGRLIDTVPFAAGTIITVTLPASGVAGVAGYLVVLYEFS